MCLPRFLSVPPASPWGPITHTRLLSRPRQARGPARLAPVSFSGPGGRASGSAVGFIDSFLFLPARICCFSPERSSFSSLEFPVGLLQTSLSLRRSRQGTRRGLHAFFSFLRSFDGLQGSGSRPWPTEAASLGFSFLLFRGYARLSACLRTFGHSLSISRGTGAPGSGRPASPRRSPSPGRLLVDSLTSPRNRFRHLSLPRRVATEVSAQVPFF